MLEVGPVALRPHLDRLVLMLDGLDEVPRLHRDQPLPAEAQALHPERRLGAVAAVAVLCRDVDEAVGTALTELVSRPECIAATSRAGAWAGRSVRRSATVRRWDPAAAETLEISALSFLPRKAPSSSWTAAIRARSPGSSAKG